MSRVSVIIPSRFERWLQPTIDDLLQHAAGDVEILPVLDGYRPDPPLRDDPRVTPLYFAQRIGMRDGINAAARVASGEFILKADGHTSWGEGWDEILKADCDVDWVVVPRRMSLDVEHWCHLANGKPPIDAHYLSYPFERDHGDCGLHGTWWPARAKQVTGDLIEEMSSQGSAWFTRKAYFDSHIGPLNTALYGSSFFAEFQEIGLKTWLGGGKVMVNRRTHYLHLHKGRTYGTGYQFNTAEWKQWQAEAATARNFAIRYWMLDQWAERVHDLRWLIERFSPVPSWPADLDFAFADARRRLSA